MSLVRSYWEGTSLRLFLPRGYRGVIFAARQRLPLSDHWVHSHHTVPLSLRVQQKEVGKRSSIIFFSFSGLFRSLLVTFSDASLTFFVTFLPNSFCRTPIVGGWKSLAKPMVSMQVAFHENDGHHENDETTKTTQTATNKKLNTELMEITEITETTKTTGIRSAKHAFSRDWKNQDLPLGMKISSANEHFKRGTHQGLIFVQGGGILEVKIGNFKRDRSFQARLKISSGIVFCQVGPLGNKNNKK